MNKKTTIITSLIVFFIIISCIVLVINYKNWFADNSSLQTENKIEYKNSQYGFGFNLPQNWKNYSILADSWEGFVVEEQGNTITENGPLIRIRNPKWTTENPYQDIPVMIFTLTQWNSLQNDEFHIGAAPINPSELGRNSNYVFALPARYNYDFLTGYEEVQDILDNQPLYTF